MASPSLVSCWRPGGSWRRLGKLGGLCETIPRANHPSGRSCFRRALRDALQRFGMLPGGCGNLPRTGAAGLLAQPDGFYRTNGYAVLLALALLFAWPLAAWRFSSMQVTGPGAALTGNS